MRRHSIITEDIVLQLVKVLRWATRFILVLYFWGVEKRAKAIERLLPQLEQEGKLAVTWHKGEKVYSVARKKRVKPVSIEHEIAFALILVLFLRCRMQESEIVPERAFRRFGIVPEGGIRYPEERNTMLIFEYCTRSNFTHGGVMKSKITRYMKYLPAMEAKFKRSITVLFVIDIDRSRVREFVGTLKRDVGSVADGRTSASSGGDSFPFNPFFFTDYKTFLSVPISEQMISPIYFWIDGKEYPLKKDV